MLEYYLQVKRLHVAAVLCSGSLFLLRGTLVQFGAARWAMAAPMRYGSYAIDTVVLTAALMLLTMLPHAVFANGWPAGEAGPARRLRAAGHPRAQARAHGRHAPRLLRRGAGGLRLHARGGAYAPPARSVAPAAGDVLFRDAPRSKSHRSCPGRRIERPLDPS
jgi:hypothetical protein